MNIVKLYRIRGGELVTKRVRCTQATGFWHKLARTRTVPYAHEVKAWALNHGWALTKRDAFREAE